MFTRTFLPALVVALAVDLAAAPAARQSGRSPLESEEQAVHAALLDSILSRVAANVVELDTVTLDDPGAARRLIPRDAGGAAGALADYVGKNAKPYLLEEKPASRYRLIRPARLEGPIPCPCLRIALSRVGFNQSKDRALARVRYERNGKSTDQYVVLKKVEEGWKIERGLARFVR